MVTTTTTASFSSTTCGTSAQYELPVKDAACGIPNTTRYKPYIEKCALPAGVQSYNHECALYAPAVDQSIQELTKCLYDAGVQWKDVWCFGDTNATATASSYPTATRTGVTGKDSKTTAQETSTSTSDGASSSTTSSNSAVTLLRGHLSVNAAFILTLLFLGLLSGI